MIFFSLTMQKFCSPIFPSLQDLLSHQLLILTTFFSHTSRSLHLLSKNWFSEQILLKRRAWLYGMDFFEWYTWQEVAWRYWWVSVDLTNTSVSNWFPSFIISTSKKSIRSLEYFEVNLMLRWSWLRISKNSFNFSSPCSHNKKISSMYLQHTIGLKLRF